MGDARSTKVGKMEGPRVSESWEKSNYTSGYIRASAKSRTPFTTASTMLR